MPRQHITGLPSYSQHITGPVKIIKDLARVGWCSFLKCGGENSVADPLLILFLALHPTILSPFLSFFSFHFFDFVWFVYSILYFRLSKLKPRTLSIQQSAKVYAAAACVRCAHAGLLIRDWPWCRIAGTVVLYIYSIRNRTRYLVSQKPADI
jgi:hypothetical protein